MNTEQVFIGGQWRSPASGETYATINPATEDSSEGGFAPLPNLPPFGLRGQSPRSDRSDPERGGVSVFGTRSASVRRT
jgi:hypothetical protein